MKLLLALPLILAGFTSLPDNRGNNHIYALKKLITSPVAVKASLGNSRQGRSIDAYYFPGTGKGRAMVIGGVHGSELSSIEVANKVIDQLRDQGGFLPYSVLVIPCLFPDNAALAKSRPSTIGSVLNEGRYSHSEAVDPNRQMPSVGKPFCASHPVDHLGRNIEKENQLLLDIITTYRPDRIVNLHAIRNMQYAGIYADPRTDHNGIALGFEEDSLLAISMAGYVQSKGGYIPGNKLGELPTALYYCDPPAAPSGELQKRTSHGAVLPGKRGHGISLGTWASTAVYDSTDIENNRPAIQLITVEFPGYKRPSDYPSATQQQYFEKLVTDYAGAIFYVFLSGSTSLK